VRIYMHASIKVLIGLILIGIGLGLFVDSISPQITTRFFYGDWLQNFVIVLTGVIPAFFILIGLFVVWLEIDEIKAERELKAEEEKAKAESKKTRGRKKK
jgi:predicted membrane protein